MQQWILIGGVAFCKIIMNKAVLSVGILTIKLLLPGCTSLKEKRGRIKPLLARLHRQFNISVAEIDHLDSWQESVIACSLVSNDSTYTQKVLQNIIEFINNSWFDLQLFDHHIELL